MHPSVDESHRTVLVVDDDANLRTVMRRLLSRAGCSVVTAGDGQVALEALHSGLRPCVVVTDLQMPVMDGWKFIARVRSTPTLQGLPICVLSADGNVQVSGASVTLNKPEGIAELVRVVVGFCHCTPEPGDDAVAARQRTSAEERVLNQRGQVVISRLRLSRVQPPAVW